MICLVPQYILSIGYPADKIYDRDEATPKILPAKVNDVTVTPVPIKLSKVFHEERLLTLPILAQVSMI